MVSPDLLLCAPFWDSHQMRQNEAKTTYNTNITHTHMYMSAAAVAVNANANVTANSAKLSELAKRIQIANRVQLTRRFCGQRDQVCVANNIIAIYGIACVIVSDHKYVCTLFTLIAFNAKTHLALRSGISLIVIASQASVVLSVTAAR